MPTSPAAYMAKNAMYAIPAKVQSRFPREQPQNLNGTESRLIAHRTASVSRWSTAGAAAASLIVFPKGAELASSDCGWKFRM